MYMCILIIITKNKEQGINCMNKDKLFYNIKRLYKLELLIFLTRKGVILKYFGLALNKCLISPMEVSVRAIIVHSSTALFKLNI